jgi:hypothetical protein
LYSGILRLILFQIAYDREIAAIEDGPKWVLHSRLVFEHITVHADLTAAILQSQQTKCGPGQPRAVKIIRHIQALKPRGILSQIHGSKFIANTGMTVLMNLSGRDAEQEGDRDAAKKKSISWLKQQVYTFYYYYVSHWSKIKLPTFRTVVVVDLLSLSSWFSSRFPFTLFQYYVLRLGCLFRWLFLYQWGLIPRMPAEKPTAEGGGLSRICWSVYFLAFRNLQFRYLYGFVFCPHSHDG